MFSGVIKLSVDKIPLRHYNTIEHQGRACFAQKNKKGGQHASMSTEGALDVLFTT